MYITTHIGARVFLIAGILALSVGLFYVRAQEPEITYGTYYRYTKFDLRVDSTASYNGEPYAAGTWSLKNLKPGVDKFWNFDDIKPGDSGENTISLHVNKDAWICLEFLNLEEEENGINEPESHEDADQDGELAQWMHFFAWHDDGNNIFEEGEEQIFGPASAKDALDNQVYPIADYTHGPALPKDETSYIGIYWCAGELTVDVPTATIVCDGEPMGNEAQTDSVSVDVQLFALPTKDFYKFKCSKIVLPPPGEQCEVGKVEIEVENNATIINNTTSSSDTGGNSADGGTVETGEASSTATTTNVVNTNIFNSFQNFFKKK